MQFGKAAGVQSFLVPLCGMEFRVTVHVVGTRSLASCWCLSGQEGEHCAHTTKCLLCASETYSVTETMNILPPRQVLLTGVMLPGHSEVNGAVTILCRLLLCRALGNSACKVAGHYCTRLYGNSE